MLFAQKSVVGARAEEELPPPNLLDENCAWFLINGARSPFAGSVSLE